MPVNASGPCVPGGKILSAPVFEKYTEKARRVVFFARYEASDFGSEYIETEHLLLGTLREDRALWVWLLKAPVTVQSIREQVERQLPRREKISTSVDLPLSRECKRVLAHAAEEAERLKDDHIAPEHFLLGVLREPECGASKVMAAHGITSFQLEQSLLPPIAVLTPAAGPAPVTSLFENSRDLTADAIEGRLNPLIGREREMERTIGILSRRARNNPVMIGEPGVGKNALVEGLAQRIANGVVPEALAERSIVAIDASSLLSFPRDGKLPGIGSRPNPILYVQGLFDLAGKGGGWSALEALRVLEPHLEHGGVQCIATGTPSGLRLTAERAESLARHFEVVSVMPPGEEEAIRIVSGVKERYEKFHGVVFTNEAIETAVSASRWFLRHRQLPDRAIDLIDDAGARVKLRGESEPSEIAEIRKRIRTVVREMEKAIVNHEFAKARLYSEEERKERQNMQRLLEGLGKKPQSHIVNAEDVVEAVASRAGVQVSAVRSMQQVKGMETVELVARELTAEFPVGGREWAEALAGYLAGCSPEEAEKLALAIRAAKAKLG
jgi:ATP-dependent Clp protease ATP-binding subunit ClpC